jgi:hypothetical protein
MEVEMRFFVPKPGTGEYAGKTGVLASQLGNSVRLRFAGDHYACYNTQDVIEQAFHVGARVQIVSGTGKPMTGVITELSPEKWMQAFVRIDGSMQTVQKDLLNLRAVVVPVPAVGSYIQTSTGLLIKVQAAEPAGDVVMIQGFTPSDLSTEEHPSRTYEVRGWTAASETSFVNATINIVADELRAVLRNA